MKYSIGVLGSGSFGTAIASLAAHNSDILLYSRHTSVIEEINTTHSHLGYKLSPNIKAIDSLEELAQSCKLIFLAVPSANFREMMKAFAPYLSPEHFLIHCTKGFDTNFELDGNTELNINRSDFHLISDVIKQESSVIRIGVLSGPNLAKEIMVGKPTASVIFSDFDEVISAGIKALSSEYFAVFGSYEMVGAEIAGALKNVIAIGAGILKGKELGKNIEAVLINRGMVDMIALGQKLGSTPKAFLGTAGMGDLICTATSKDSRNYKFGLLLGSGKSIPEILDETDELAEGYRTAWIVEGLSKSLGITLPIFSTIYKVLYKDYPIDSAIKFLMKFPNYTDVDFI
jgi:glycerol-3-phosphate dehydrogenase (NAD(P)+)